MPWAVAALLFAVLTVVKDRQLAGADVGPVALPTLVDDCGSPLTLGRVTPRDLGVHPSRFGDEGQGLYIPRDVDEELADALNDGRANVVLVHGPRLAGITSVLAQAAQLYLPDHRVLGFVDDPQIRLSALLECAALWASDGAGAVLWLDGATTGRLTEVAATAATVSTGVRVLVSADEECLKEVRELVWAAKALDQNAIQIEVGPLSPVERQETAEQDVYAVLRPLLAEPGPVWMGRLMVTWDRLRAALTPGSDRDSRARVALLRAAVDWERAPMPLPLTRKNLLDLSAGYVPNRKADGPIPPTELRRVLKRLVASPSGSLPQLLEETGHGDGKTVRAHRLLPLLGDDTAESVSWTIDPNLWAWGVQHLNASARRKLGCVAVEHEAWSEAADLWDPLDTELGIVPMLNLARALDGLSDVERARGWYRAAITRQDPNASPNAMGALGYLEYRAGDFAEARRWYLRAAQSGHPDLGPAGMVNVGILERDAGDAGAARNWYKRAIETEHPDHAPKAMFNFGVLEYDAGDVAAARDWYTLVIQTGHPGQAARAMVSLGVMDDGAGDAAAAREWYTQAVETEDPDEAPRALFNLGILEAKAGDIGAARDWYTQAVGTGHSDHAPTAMRNLGSLERDLGNVSAARSLYECVIETGHPEQAPQAMINLGFLEQHKAENTAAARGWFMRAVGTGHPKWSPAAMVNLGILERDEGNAVAARGWFRQAMETGHPDEVPHAMLHLGILERDVGNVEAARDWFTQAVETKHHDQAPNAMIYLGILERDAGNVAAAHGWLTQSVETEHAQFSVTAGQYLREMERQAAEHKRAQNFAKYGWQAYADPELMSGPVAPDNLPS